MNLAVKVVVVFFLSLFVAVNSSPTLSYGSARTDAAPLSNWQEWQDAKSLYDSQNFSDALKVFLAHPRSDASFFYNLGTTYYRLSQYGPAVAYLEKANRMHLHDPDIQFNLSLARSALARTIGQEKLDVASTGIEQLADRVSLDEIRTSLGFMGIILLLVWIRAYLKTRHLKQALFNPGGLLAMLGFGIAAGLYGIQRWSDASPPAACLERQVVRSGPSEHFLELSQMEAGSKIRLLGPSALSDPTLPNTTTPNENLSPSATPPPPETPKPEMWVQIRYSQDGVGWIKSSGLLPL